MNVRSSRQTLLYMVMAGLERLGLEPLEPIQNSHIWLFSAIS